MSIGRMTDPYRNSKRPEWAPNIAEFLLARIAEDEGVAGRYHRLLCLRTACDAECCWGEATDEEIAAERVCTCNYPARVLAECEAKRRIVEWHGERSSYDCDECSARNNDGWPCRTLRTLASIYADHPDFREEWRAEAQV